jgi:hypothetical protein
VVDVSWTWAAARFDDVHDHDHVHVHDGLGAMKSPDD